MAVNAISLQLKLAWQQSRANLGTNDTGQQGHVDADLAGVNPAVWDELYQEIFALSPTNPDEEVDLQAVFNLVDSAAFAFHRVLVLYVKNLGNASGAGSSVVRLTRGDAYPLDWFFGTTTSAFDLPVGRTLLVSDSPAGNGSPVTPTASNLKFSLHPDTAGDEAIVEVVVYGSTQS